MLLLQEVKLLKLLTKEIISNFCEYMVCFKDREHASFFIYFGKYGSCLFNYVLMALGNTYNPLFLHFLGAQHVIYFQK